MSLLLKQIPDLPEALTASGTDLIHIRNGSVDKKITVTNFLSGHVDDLANPHQVTKAQLGLGALTGNAVLEQANNLSDILDAPLARTNLGVPSIGDLSNAVPTGVILLWSGSIGSIPAGYALCDGTGGTPNLQGRFVIGAKPTAPYEVDETGGASSVDHNHSVNVNGHKLTYDEIPPHQHNSGWGEKPEFGPSFGSVPGGGRLGSGSSDRDNVHYLTGGIIYDQNGAVSHNDNAAHTHTAVSGDTLLDITPPYYALAYIIKL